MKRKFFTSMLILMVALSMSFTSVFADALSVEGDQDSNAQPTAINSESIVSDSQAEETAPGTSRKGASNAVDSNSGSNVTPSTVPEETGETNQEPEPTENGLCKENTGIAQRPETDVPVTGTVTVNEEPVSETNYNQVNYNTADAALSATLSGDKDDSLSLTWGKPLSYTVKMTALDEAPAPSKSKVSFKLSNTYKKPKAEKKLSFGKLTFNAPGVYKYKVSEAISSKQRDVFGIYDEKERILTITVEAKEESSADENPEQVVDLEVTSAKVSGGKVFKNKFYDVDRPHSFMQKPAGINTVKTNLPGGFKHATVYQCESRSTNTGMYVVWYTVKGAKGYLIYKKHGKNGKWKYRAKVKGYMHISYRDKAVHNGEYYEYKVIARTRGTSRKPSIKASDNTGIMGNYFLRKPTVSGGSTVSWATNPKADGMRIEVAKNKVFVGARSYMIPKGTNRFKIPNYANKYGGYRYVRVMPYKKYDGRYHYGLPWLNHNTYKNMTSTVEFIVKDKYKDNPLKHQNKKDIKEMLYEADSKFHCGTKMWKWDTTQGITYDGKYAYMNVENRYANSILVLKLDTTDNFNVVKVSKPVRGCHGNDITYNSDTGLLYITYSYFNKRYVAKMDPKTMKYKGRQHIKVPYNVAGKHGHLAINNLNCYNEIEYDNVKKQYLLKKKESHSMVVLDKNFKVIRYMRIHERVEITNQNMQSTPEFFYRVQSNYQSNQKDNYVTVFDWHGTGISHFRMKFDNVLGKAELENIFFIGDQLYGACYKKWWDKKPVGSTVKVDKVKRHGKWVFKTKKVTKKNQKKLKQLRRTSYIFRIKLFG